mmetsp:Transcript_55675/g.166781  ORF Transcript_55675/g.166781 Transcript_55675/m.166781 type:complete len:138 (+) Transcript_55675:2020-2433(+)
MMTPDLHQIRMVWIQQHPHSVDASSRLDPEAGIAHETGTAWVESWGQTLWPHEGQIFLETDWHAGDAEDWDFQVHQEVCVEVLFSPTISCSEPIAACFAGHEGSVRMVREREAERVSHRASWASSDRGHTRGKVQSV